jgi:hypothetical protein
MSHLRFRRREIKGGREEKTKNVTLTISEKGTYTNPIMSHRREQFNYKEGGKL